MRPSTVGIVDRLAHTVELLAEAIDQLVVPPNPTSATLNLRSHDMPLTLPDTDRAVHTATVSYKNADGSDYTGPTDKFTAVFSSGDLNLATIDPTSGQWSLIGGDGTDTITVKVTLPDGTVLSADDTVTAEAPVVPFPASITLTLS